jgi:hypothetical protein
VSPRKTNNGLRPARPGGDGEMLSAAALLLRWDCEPGVIGRRVRLNPGGGEYEAVLLRVQSQTVGSSQFVRLTHQRDGLHPTINVVPPSTEVRILK